MLTNAGQQAAVQQLEHACEAAQSPLMKIEHALQPWVAFGIIPLFALANAGVNLANVDVRAALTATQVAIPLTDGRLALGTWQGIYVYEHRRHGHRREVALHLLGQG